MPYSWKLSTTISNNEASENYKEVNDPAVMVGHIQTRSKCTVAHVTWIMTKDVSDLHRV